MTITPPKPSARTWCSTTTTAALLSASSVIRKYCSLDQSLPQPGTVGMRSEGKGRKHRAVPLTGPMINLVRAWLTERAGRPADPLYPGRPTAQPRRRRATRPHPRRGRYGTLPLLGRQTDPPTRASAQLRHDPAVSRSRRAVSGPRLLSICHRPATTGMTCEPRPRTNPTGSGPYGMTWTSSTPT